MNRAPKGGKGKTAEAPVQYAEVPPEHQVDGKQLWIATDALQKAKAMRNYFQLERDKITAYWEITRRELETTRALIRQRDREKAELLERHQVELKVYKQKMRHVLYEQQVQMAELKLEAERALKCKQEEHREREAELLEDIRSLKLQQREQELHHIDARHALKMKQDVEISEQLQDFERQMKEMNMKYDKKIKALREEMDKRRNDEIAAIERRKEEHITELREAHDKAFQDIKEYYNEITSNNLETIRTLKDEVYTRKRTEAQNEKAMFEIAQTNKRLTEPLTRAQKQRKQLEAELLTYERDRTALKAAKQELHQLEHRHKTISWEHEVLQQRFAKLQSDRDLVFRRYTSMLQEIQQKAVFKAVLAHHKLEVVSSQLEKKDAQLSEVLRRAQLDSQTAEGVERHVNDLIGEKDRTIAELQELLAALTQRHEQVATAYEIYLRQNGVVALRDGIPDTASATSKTLARLTA